jgi:hypothetical protein
MAAKTFDPQRLIDILQAKCPRELWSRSARRLFRYVQTYLMMADVKYRPGAPSDCFSGAIYLSKEELADEDRLYHEAVDYALKFDKDEEEGKFFIGSSNYETNRAFILAIEAARLLNTSPGNKYALRLLRMAIEEIENANKERQERHSAKECTL